MPATAFRIARCHDALAPRSVEECKALAFTARRAIHKAYAQRARIGRARVPKAAGVGELAPKTARAPIAASSARSPPANREWARLYDQAMRAFVADVETRLTVVAAAKPLIKRVTFKLSEIDDAPPPPARPPAPKRAHSEGEAAWVTELRSCLRRGSKHRARERV